MPPPDRREGDEAPTPAALTRDRLAALRGPVVVEFGASWCGHCRALAPRLAALLGEHPAVRHFQVEDGPGLPLGRSFRVTLWPTLVFLSDGRPVRQVARPSEAEVRAGLEAIAGGG